MSASKAIHPHIASPFLFDTDLTQRGLPPLTKANSANGVERN